MSRSKLILKDPYQQLTAALKTQVFEAKHAIERTFVMMYWTVGRTIEQYLTRYGNIAPDGRNIYISLSEEIDIDVRTLNQTVVFYRAYPKFRHTLPLSWSHYRYLSMIDSPRERRYWEKRVVKEHLSCHDMQMLIRSKKGDPYDGKSGAELSFTRGALYHYRLIKVGYLNKAAETLMVDCGFENRTVVPKASGVLDNKRVVFSGYDENGYFLKLSRKTVDHIYTYKAVIEKVVDADTLLANIDCGFGFWTRQRLRLKGIDAPEKNTLAGKSATRACKQKIKNCPFVIVKTYKSDKYDRYLADIFYLPKSSDLDEVAACGRFLNQELIDEGLANLWRG